MLGGLLGDMNPIELMGALKNPFKLIKNLLPDNSIEQVQYYSRLLKEEMGLEEKQWQDFLDDPDFTIQYLFSVCKDSGELKIEAVGQTSEGKKVTLFRVHESFIMKYLHKIFHEAKSTDDSKTIALECLDKIKKSKRSVPQPNTTSDS